MVRYGNSYSRKGAYLEAVFEVVILLQESGIVDDNLGVCNPQLQNLVIDSLSGFHRANRFLQIDVERPKLDGFEKSRLGGQCLWSQNKFISIFQKERAYLRDRDS